VTIPGAAQVAPQGYRCVTGFDRAGQDFWKEWLIGHVRARVDDREFGFVSA
jgi:hypothetical protein